MHITDILEFRGVYRFLSNFWTSPVFLDGIEYPSIENAYQAAKTHPALREPFVHYSAAEAKAAGRKVPMRADWDVVKLTVMRMLVAQKFAPRTPLAKQLLETGDALIVEGNTWGDTFWGVCKGRGTNWLGVILMAQRAFLQQFALGRTAISPGSMVLFDRHIYRVTGVNDAKRTFDLHRYPNTQQGDAWRNVPLSVLHLLGDTQPLGPYRNVTPAAQGTLGL